MSLILAPPYVRIGRKIGDLLRAPMRHDKAAALLDLSRRLAGSAEGLTLDEMAAAAGVGRRTAERMRDALEQLFPQMEILADGPVRRFRIPKGLDGFLQAPAREELLELAKAAADLRRSGQIARAQSLERLAMKIRSAMRSAALRRVDADLDVLARAEASIARVGPRPHEDGALLADLRQAIMAMKAVTFTYQGGSRPGSVRTVCPYGLIFERTNYLIAAEIGRTAPRTFRLDRIEGLVVTHTPAAPPESFDLEDFAAQSFGVFQDAPEDVALRVRPSDADEARGWRFHRSQTLEAQPDGGLIVRFRSGGMKELAWHLFTWEDKIKVLSPPRLKAVLAAQLRQALAHHVGEAGSD